MFSNCGCFSLQYLVCPCGHNHHFASRVAYSQKRPVVLSPYEPLSPINIRVTKSCIRQLFPCCWCVRVSQLAQLRMTLMFFVPKNVDAWGFLLSRIFIGMNREPSCNMVCSSLSQSWQSPATQKAFTEYLLYIIPPVWIHAETYF